MEAVVSVVVPVFGLVALGYGAAAGRWFDEAVERGLSVFVFNFATPALLFGAMARTTLPDSVAWGFVTAYFGAALLAYAMAVAGGRGLFALAWRELSIFGFAAAFSNTVMMGIPLVLTAFGDDAAAPLFHLIALHSLVLFPVVTIFIEATERTKTTPIVVLRNTLASVVRNPILAALMAGLAWNLAGWRLPGMLANFVDLLGAAAIPCALLALGGSLVRYRLGDNWRQALAIVAIKLIFMPALVWLLAVAVFDLDRVWASVAIVMAALPSGVNVYVFAVRYGISVATASNAILLSTILSFPSLAILLWLLTTY